MPVELDSVQSLWNLKQRASAATGAAIKIMDRVNVKAVSLPMAGYTQATTPASPARSRASLDPEGRFQTLIVVLHDVL